MYCVKCGGKLQGGTSFCPSCGKAAKGAISLPSLKMPSLKKFLFIPIILIAILGIILGIYFGQPILNNLLGKIAGNQFAVFDAVETRYLKEAKERASNWSSQARLYFFLASIDKMDQTNPNITYTFFSPDKKTEFNYQKFADGRVVTNEDSKIYNEGNEIVSFPNLTAREATRLATKYFNKDKTAKQNIEQLTVSIFEINDFWRVVLYINSGEPTLKKSECRVYFNQKVECDPLKQTNYSSSVVPTQPSPGKITANFSTLKDIEYKNFVMAKGFASTWSANAYLCNFYVSVSDLQDTMPYQTFTFCAAEKETIYDVTYFRTAPGETKETKNERGYKKRIPSFAPRVNAKEAVELAISKYNSIKPATTTVTNFSLILREEDDHWWVGLTTINSSKERKFPHCYVYFDKKVECKD